MRGIESIVGTEYKRMEHCRIEYHGMQYDGEEFDRIGEIDTHLIK